MASVRIRNLTKKFGESMAVDDLSLDIGDKEFLVLLGPSGCGKTTTLRCLAGLEIADSGEIYMDDAEVSYLPPKDRDIAMVFQNYALYPHKSVWDNLAFPLKMRRRRREVIESSVKRIADLLRIGHLLKRKPRQLSGGEAQRVALGRALIREPRVFLMDEPLSNLDAKLRLYMRAELKKLQREVKITTIYVTHDQAEAMTMADRIAIMNQGKLQQVGTPDMIYKNPSNSFVAGFMGSPPMNLLECTYKEKNGSSGLDFGAFRYELKGHLKDLVKSSNSGPEFLFGVRPEHVSASTNKIEDGIQGEVYITEPLGSEVIVDVKVGDLILKSKATEFSGNLGEKVWISFRYDAIRMFDGKHGQAIT